MKKIYFDYAASTPVDSAVTAAMQPYFSKIFGNPSSLHQFGQEASGAVFLARQKIAESIGANYREIIFTGSATEANNLALRGVLKMAQRSNKPGPYRIITSEIEHESVLETCRDLEKEGIEAVYVPVSKEGIVDLEKLKAALNDKTILVSIMHANNEVGVIQPISKIAQIIGDFRKQIANRKSQSVNDSRLAISPWPLLHTDAVQSFQYLDCDVQSLGVDFMTLSAHKIYGPKGIGVLYAKFFNGRYSISPIITGGDQQGGIRPGTENTPNIVGFAKAVELAVKNRKQEAGRVQTLRDYFLKNLKRALPDIAVNGSMTQRLPNNLNVYFPGNTAQDLIVKLDLAGVAVSSGAACAAHTAQSSYVLEALGLPLKRSAGSLRFSLGRQTTKKEIDRVTRVLKKLNGQ